MMLTKNQILKLIEEETTGKNEWLVSQMIIHCGVMHNMIQIVQNMHWRSIQSIEWGFYLF